MQSWLSSKDVRDDPPRRVVFSFAMILTMDDASFRKEVLNHWKRHGRHDLPWRQTTDPYHILVSEIMLQQTQVDRVIPKYQAFLKRFPSFRSLARAGTADVLRMWQGLGYNRRALMLQRCAQIIVGDQEAELLPGIGPYTAGAILAFAYNSAVPMIETNIRRIYLHHYFPGQEGIGDDQLLPIVERTLDRRNPRRWYSALMDYGTALAASVPNPNRRSRHYTRQSKFEGSRRQLRGQVLRALLAGTPIPRSHAAQDVVAQLEKEGFR